MLVVTSVTQEVLRCQAALAWSQRHPPAQAHVTACKQADFQTSKLSPTLTHFLHASVNSCVDFSSFSRNWIPRATFTQPSDLRGLKT